MISSQGSIVPNRAEHIAAALPAGIGVLHVQGACRERIGHFLGDGRWSVRCRTWCLTAGRYRRAELSESQERRPWSGPGGRPDYLAWKHLDSVQAWLRAEAHRPSLAKLTTPSPWLAAWHGFLEVFLQILAGALAGFVAGYISHIVLDLQTPWSVPLVW
jgi:hypothetical protein